MVYYSANTPTFEDLSMDHDTSSPSPTPSISSPIWAGWVHILAFVAALLTSWTIGFAGMLVGFVFWVIQKDRQNLVAQNAAECFNFNLSMFLYTCGILLFSGVFALVTLGLGLVVLIPLLLVIGLIIAVMWLVLSIIAAREGFEGKVYRYPLTMRFLK